MSILIKGAEMPKSCWDCELGSAQQLDGRPCPFYSTDFSEQQKYSDKRADGCPLVHVPPHGIMAREQFLDAIRLELAQANASNDMHPGRGGRGMKEGKLYEGNIVTAPIDCSSLDLDEFGLFREKTKELPNCMTCESFEFRCARTDSRVFASSGCSFHHQARLTNSRRLRSLTDTELASSLRGCPDSVEVCPNIPCADCWLNWLQKEVPP